MKYLCLVYGEEAALQACKDQDCLDFDAQARANGQVMASEALESVATATTVRVRNGKLSVTDGPFAETKEQLAGYMILDAPNLDEVLDFTRHHPLAQAGLAIEIRPLRGGPGEMDTGAKPAPRF